MLDYNLTTGDGAASQKIHKIFIVIPKNYFTSTMILLYNTSTVILYYIFNSVVKPPMHAIFSIQRHCFNFFKFEMSFLLRNISKLPTNFKIQVPGVLHISIIQCIFLEEIHHLEYFYLLCLDFPYNFVYV